MLRAYLDGAVFGEAFGATPPRVLALHGWAHDHHDFDAVARRCADLGLGALAIDLPGFGRSPAPERAWGSAEYAEGLAPVLDQMATRPILVGHSFGGLVALQLAVRSPDRIGGLLLTGAPLRTAGERRTKSPLGYRALRALAHRGLVPSGRLERARERYGSPDYRAAEGVMREILVRTVNETYDTLFAKVHADVELVWGELDTAATVAQARRAVAALPTARLTVVPNVGHMTPIDAIGALTSAIERLAA